PRAAAAARATGRRGCCAPSSRSRGRARRWTARRPREPSVDATQVYVTSFCVILYDMLSLLTASQPATGPSVHDLAIGAAGGAILLGLSALQGEFDYGVPQYQLVFQPILLMLAAGIGLVAARIRIGRGGALYSVLFWLVVRGLLALVIAGPLGRSTPHFPL